jgi:hypothetical protein
MMIFTQELYTGNFSAGYIHTDTMLVCHFSLRFTFARRGRFAFLTELFGDP